MAQPENLREPHPLPHISRARGEELDTTLTVEDIEIDAVRERVDDIQVIGDPILTSVRVSVVIPTLNEADNLPHVFDRMPREVAEVILVDGHSTDGTVEVAERLWPGLKTVT